MPLDTATQSKNQDRFLFDQAPGWALGYDSNQWIILISKNVFAQTFSTASLVFRTSPTSFLNAPQVRHHFAACWRLPSLIQLSNINARRRNGPLASHTQALSHVDVNVRL